jgi:hypothetical protein
LSAPGSPDASWDFFSSPLLSTFYRSTLYADEVGIPPRGVESFAKTPEKPRVGSASGAESGALGAKHDADLTQVVVAWPNLPADVRKMIAGVVAATVAAKSKRE